MAAQPPNIPDPRRQRELTHEEFRRTPGYADLCQEYGINPAADWSDETCASLDDAAEFFRRYEQMRRGLPAWNPDTAAAWVEGLVLRHEADPGAPVFLDRWGPVVVVQDPQGECWQFTAARPDPKACGTALARHHAGKASPS
jgi:hypothetical protein